MIWNVFHGFTYLVKEAREKPVWRACFKSIVFYEYQSASFPACHCQWAHEYRGRGDRDEDYVWAQQGGLSLTRADLATATAKCQICQEQKPVLILQ